MKELDFNKEFTCGDSTITRQEYEDLISPLCTSPLTDEDMQSLVNAIEYEVQLAIYEQGIDKNDDSAINTIWWETMERLGIVFGMYYYEDED